MTNSPADLLDLRTKLMSVTGISNPSDVGIVGDSAHAATGGYHEGKTDLINVGVFGSDYSTRLTRDRNGCTESASAMDVGANWVHGGRSAWIRFNNLFVTALHANDTALKAVRAANYTPNGTTKLRTDRESGWSVVTSGDSVDIHTHIEWYRDTENTASRAQSIARIVALATQAITGVAPAVAGAAKVGDKMIFGEIPTGFGIDENNQWVDKGTENAINVPLPAVGTDSGEWGSAWLYAASNGDALLRMGAYPSATWYDLKSSLTHAAGPTALPAGTTSLILTRKKQSATDTADDVAIRWHIQYNS